MSDYACRPTHWGSAATMYGYKGGAWDLGYVVHTDEMWIVPGPETSDGVPRIELTPRQAMINRKVYGFVTEIIESGQMLNTETRYRLVAIVQIVYYKDGGQSDDSWMWVKTSASTSYALVVGTCGVMIGSIIAGVLPPTAGPHLTTRIESWAPSSCRGWQLNGIGGGPKPRYFDIDPETTDQIPAIGGSGFDISRLRYAIA